MLFTGFVKNSHLPSSAHLYSKGICSSGTLLNQQLSYREQQRCNTLLAMDTSAPQAMQILRPTKLSSLGKVPREDDFAEETVGWNTLTEKGLRLQVLLLIGVSD